MNPIFVLLMSIFFLYTWISDRSAWRKAGKAAKTCYILMNSASVFLFTAFLFHLWIPMPTEWFIHHVSPWVRAIVEGNSQGK